MKKPLYGFLQDEKWYEDVGHILIGLIPLAGWIHEHFQYPPGWPVMINYFDRNGKRVVEEMVQLRRVDDLYRDNLGYAIGGAIRTSLLVGLLVWRW